MTQAEPIYVRGRCACGKRYRIRNARVGSVVLCPNCQRVIHLTDADLQSAGLEEHLIPLQAETAELLEAVPVNHGALRMAPEGSPPGLTGARVLSHEEAVLAYSARGNLKFTDPYEQASRHRPSIWTEFEPAPRPFLLDLLASFYFAGVPRNAITIVAMAAAYSLLTLVQYLFLRVPLLLVLLIPIYALIMMYTVQFYWAVLRHTANAEDVIPWGQEQWSFWYDSVVPLFRLALISFLCTLPYLILVRLQLPYFVGDPMRAGLVLAAGWFFWPVAAMSVAVGDSLGYLRPDWLIRSIIGIGPAYLPACLAAMLTVGVWYYFIQNWFTWMWLPIIGIAANMYLGYVLFRTCGLLFRHYRERLPWKL